MDDPRWEPGMPVLDRQPVPEAAGAASGAGRAPGASTLPPSLRDLPPRSVPETHPTPLQPYYINLSVVALICGAIAITALELGAGLGSPLVKLCVIVGAPILVATTADATLRIWRSAWAWMPVDRGKGLFRLCWVVVALVGIALLAIATLAVLVA
ncbi:MAG TPA: hypothetical protein VEG29_07720 [Candidatus Binatia bacterium]|nr:hypothetical protein [Candidatus Binatia bacterium]